MSADQCLNDLGIELPPAPKPAGVYKPLLITAITASSDTARSKPTIQHTGKVGLDVDQQHGYTRTTKAYPHATAGLGSLIESRW